MAAAAAAAAIAPQGLPAAVGEGPRVLLCSAVLCLSAGWSLLPRTTAVTHPLPPATLAVLQRGGEPGPSHGHPGKGRHGGGHGLAAGMDVDLAPPPLGEPSTPAWHDAGWPSLLFS